MDELVGHDPAPHRVAPSRERLDPDDGRRREVDLRLEVHGQSVVVECLSEITRQRQTLGSSGVEFLAVAIDSGMLRLCCIHREASSSKVRVTPWSPAGDG